MKQQHIHDRVMTSHNAFTNGTFRVLTVALLQRLKLVALAPAPGNCEVWSVIKFLNVQRIAPIEIYQLCQVYGPNVLSKQMMHHWCRQCTAGWKHVHDEEHSGRPSIIMDDLVELVWECIMENHRFTITELSSNFPHLVVQKCHGAPVVLKIVYQVSA